MEQEKRSVTFLQPAAHQEHILICLSGSPSNERVIRAAASLAETYHGALTALFVETSETERQRLNAQTRLRVNMKLAEQLGARIATVYGDNVPYQITEYANASGVTKIVMGYSNGRCLMPVPHLSYVERLQKLAPDMDLFVIPDSGRHSKTKKESDNLRRWFFPHITAADSAKAAALLLLTTVIACFLFYVWGLREASTITVFILGVLITSIITEGRMHGLLFSLLSVLIFNFFFTYPYFTFRAEGAEYPVTFLVMLIASLITSTLTRQVKAQARQMSQKAYRTEVLLETSQKLQQAKDKADIYIQLSKQMNKLLGKTILLYPVKDNQLDPHLFFLPHSGEQDIEAYTGGAEWEAAQMVLKNSSPAGATTESCQAAKCLYMAVRNHNTVFAVAGIAMDYQEGLGAFEENLLIAMLSEGALALEKEQLNEDNTRIIVQAQQGELRANLLRSISHDLRTPLTSISGNAGVLMNSASALDEAKKHTLYTDIYDDAMWLINLVENLLSVTRIENGTMNIQMGPELIDDVIQEAMSHINRRSVEYHISVHQEDDLLMANMDPRLIVQVLINLIDNAIKYTPPGTDITIRAAEKGEMVCISVSDTGGGIPDQAKEKIFEMFFSADKERGDSRRGLGLGLSLCQSIIHSHGGEISVEDNHPKGTVFRFTLQRYTQCF